MESFLLGIEHLNDRVAKSKGHFCYGCNEYFHDKNTRVTNHKDCKGHKSLGACVDSIEFGKYHENNLEGYSKNELIEIIQFLAYGKSEILKDLRGRETKL